MADHPMAAVAMTVAVAAAVVIVTETAATPAEVDHCNCYSHSLIAVFSPWARERCRISPPRFLAECHKKRLNQASFVLCRLLFLGCL